MYMRKRVNGGACCIVMDDGNVLLSGGMSGKNIKPITKKVTTTPASKREPISPDMTLSEQLLEVLDATPAGMSDDAKTIELIDFIKRSMVKCGHDPARVFVGGYQQEALIAAVLGKKPNKKPHGYDLTDEKGVHTEIKVTNTPLGRTANVNFAPPKPQANETRAHYYGRLKEINKDKGNVMVLHFYGEKGDVKSANIYVFSHEFISLVMQEKNAMEVDNVNLGGTGCTKCTRVHRLDMLLELDKEWTRDPAAFFVQKLHYRPDGCKKPAKDEKDEESASEGGSSSDEGTGDYVTEDVDDDGVEAEADADVGEEEEGEGAVFVEEVVGKEKLKLGIDTLHLRRRKTTPEEQAADEPLFTALANQLRGTTWIDLEMLGTDEYMNFVESTTPRQRATATIFWNRYIQSFILASDTPAKTRTLDAIIDDVAAGYYIDREGFLVKRQ